MLSIYKTYKGAKDVPIPPVFLALFKEFLQLLVKFGILALGNHAPHLTFVVDEILDGCKKIMYRIC